MGIWVSGGNMLGAYGGEALGRTALAPLAGAGALCVGGGDVYCAAEGDMLWRMDARSLQPRALFAGGPCMRDVCISADGRRLYALLSGADSVLMLDAADGAPLMLARAGCNPPRMALDDAAQVLAIAGGRQEAVILLDAHTLSLIREMPMPGPVCAVAAAAGCVMALCMTGERRSALAVCGRDVRFCALSGRPGALLARERGALAATKEALFACTPKAQCRRLGRLSGCPSRMAADGDRLVWIDSFREAAMCLDRSGAGVRTLCAPASGLGAYTFLPTKPT